jgi:two-component system NtrC family sensor kinase
MTETATKKSKATKRTKLSVAEKNQLLYHALVAIYQSRSVGELETALQKHFGQVFSLEWVRIVMVPMLATVQQIERSHTGTLHISDLEIRDNPIGKIIFGRKVQKKFEKSEIEFLEQISESLSQTIDRMRKLDLAETLQQQWDRTFDSISEALCLTDNDFRIIRSNAKFKVVADTTNAKSLKKNCYQIFLGQDQDIPDANREEAFLISKYSAGSKFVFEVTKQKINYLEESHPLWLVIFRDLTEQKKIEEQILQSAKLAEVGIIGSSIAHELNNPLGGMLSFIQLIKMDSSESDKTWDDLTQMEEACRRCKEIIDHLLAFSRTPSTISDRKCDLKDIVERIVKILELKARPLGIVLKLHTDGNGPFLTSGDEDLLAQAFSHSLQHTFEAVCEKLKSSNAFTGLIEVGLFRRGQEIDIILTDNGDPLSAEVQKKIFNPMFSAKKNISGLGLPLAHKIVSDHDGRMELSSQSNVGTMIKITLRAV